MFAPNKLSAPEDIGTIELFGVSLSNAVQSIMIALYELKVDFIHHSVQPNSYELSAVSPFRTIPVLVHRIDALYAHGRDKVALTETVSIARYIDELISPYTHPYEDLRLMPPLPDRSLPEYMQVVMLRTEMSQTTAIVLLRVYPTVVERFVLPYFSLRSNGAKPEDIAVALSDVKFNAEETLVMLENVIRETQTRMGVPNNKWVLGEQVTWVDVFLFPILRDFKATRQDGLLQGDQGERLPWLTGWVNRFEQRPSAQATFAGTFASTV